ncbi:MAG: integrase [Vicingaceae bacterium]|jgi:integrase
MATVKIHLDSRKTAENKGILKVSITHNRTQRLYTTGIKINIYDFQKFNEGIGKDGLSGRIKNQDLIELYEILYGTFRDGTETVSGYHKRAAEIVDKLGSKFTFEAFKYEFDNYTKKNQYNNIVNDIFIVMDGIISNLWKQERIANSNSYKTASQSLKRFLREMDKGVRAELLLPQPPKDATKPLRLSFEQITVNFLNHYEDWMLQYGRKSQKKFGPGGPTSRTTVGIYVRQIRAVFNEAISRKITENYPFGKRDYVIPAGRNIKKALTKEEINKILDYLPDSSTLEARSHAVWVFSYLGNGINVSDICRLKQSDYDADNRKITFIRQKTRRTNKSNLKEIEIYIADEHMSIIKNFGNKKRGNNAYLMDFLKPEMTEVDIMKTIQQIILITNKWMKKIAEKLEITSSCTTYVARHSFATILLQSEAPIAFISKALGHSSLATTEAYLGSFEDDKARGYMAALR